MLAWVGLYKWTSIGTYYTILYYAILARLELPNHWMEMTFFHIKFVVKNSIFVWKDRKRGRDWPIFLKKLVLQQLAKTMFRLNLILKIWSVWTKHCSRWGEDINIELDHKRKFSTQIKSKKPEWRRTNTSLCYKTYFA